MGQIQCRAPSYTAYLDNIIIYFKNELEYKEHIYKVL